MVFRCANVHPQRAKHAINDHFHSYAVAKPLTDMAHHNPQKKTLTLINGQLAAIKVKTPRGAQISTCEAPKTTMVRKCVQSTQKGYAEGVAKVKAEVALNLFKLGKSIADIATLTELTEKEIETIIGN